MGPRAANAWTNSARKVGTKIASKEQNLLVVIAQESQYYQAVITVVRMCFERLDEELDLSALATEAGYSPFHFHRIFSAMAYERPAAFIRRMRMEKAAQLLPNKALQIGAIAFECGFNSPDSFSRAFRNAFGVLPSDFRDRPFDPRIRSHNQIHFGEPIVLEPYRFGKLTMEIFIENRPDTHVLGFAHKGAYWKIGGVFQALGKWVSETKAPMIGSIAVFHDDPEKVDEADLKSDALIITPDPMQPQEGMVAYTIPAGKYLVGRHIGSYEGLPGAWQHLYGQELPKQNVVPASGDCFEIYVDDCMTTPVETLRTDLYIPIK